MNVGEFACRMQTRWRVPWRPYRPMSWHTPCLHAARSRCVTHRPSPGCRFALTPLPIAVTSLCTEDKRAAIRPLHLRELCSRTFSDRESDQKLPSIDRKRTLEQLAECPKAPANTCSRASHCHLVM